MSKIGRFMTISGEVECSGIVHLDGKVEGLFTGGTLIIGETGHLSGTIAGEAIECFGRIEGDIRTRSLQLRKTGYHVGTVETGELEVEPGAILDCALQSGSLKNIERLREQKTEKKATVPEINLTPLANSFVEGNRPCCYEVPWSARLELYDHIVDLVRRNKPLIKITGEAGSGKTNLYEKLGNSLSEKYSVLQLDNRVGSVTELLQEIGSKIGLDTISTSSSQNESLQEIAKVLEEKKSDKQKVVLLVDDAQEMYQASMEGLIRLLTGAFNESHDDGSGLLQIVLLGTEDMKSKMVTTILEYFEDETNCQLPLEPLNLKDTAEYLRLGLHLAAEGNDSKVIGALPNETIKEIHVQSRGNLQEINRLAGGSITRAGQAGLSSVPPQYVSA